jgi:glutamyl-tRNA reductase
MVGGRASTWDALHVEAAMADVLIVATGSEVPVVEAAALQRAREACAATGYALLMMDLSVPRNIDPAVTTESGITLIDLDTLHQPLLSAETMRRDAVPHAQTICAGETDAFMEWLATMPARDAIQPLRAALEDVARREVAFHSKDDSVAEKAASRIVAKLLAGPMAALRRAVQRGEPLDQHAMMLLEMFAPGGGAGATDTRRSGTHRAVAAPAPTPAAPAAPAPRLRPRVAPAASSATVPSPVAAAHEAAPLVASRHFS